MEKSTMYMIGGGVALAGVGLYLLSKKSSVTVVRASGQEQGTAYNLPINAPLFMDFKLPIAYTAPAEIRMPNGAVIPAGTILPAGTVLPKGTLMPAGFVTPTNLLGT